MNLKKIALLGALAALGAAASPAMAQSYALNTGTPTVTTGDPILSNNDWFAEEFNLTAGEAIDSLSAYLNLDTGNSGGTLTFALYSGTTLGRNPTAVETWTTTYSAPGWTSYGASYTSTNGGTYWLAIEDTSSGQTYTLPTIANTSAEPVGAAGYAYTTSGTGSKQWTVASTYPVGMQVQVVPEPETYGLVAVGLLGVVVRVRMQRRREAS